MINVNRFHNLWNLGILMVIEHLEGDDHYGNTTIILDKIGTKH